MKEKVQCPACHEWRIINRRNNKNYSKFWCTSCLKHVEPFKTRYLQVKITRSSAFSVYCEKMKAAAAEKIHDQLCFVPEEDAFHETEIDRAYSRGMRDAYKKAISEIKKL